MEKTKLFRWLFRWSPVSVFFIVMIFLCCFSIHKIETKIEEKPTVITKDIAEEDAFCSDNFPHDIMKVEFYDEIWIYRMFEEGGEIEKIIILKKVKKRKPTDEDIEKYYKRYLTKFGEEWNTEKMTLEQYSEKVKGEYGGWHFLFSSTFLL